jgi:hypothetical protein
MYTILQIKLSAYEIEQLLIKIKFRERNQLNLLTSRTKHNNWGSWEILEIRLFLFVYSIL